jgi:uncharacterized protein (DUF342 family)
MTVDHGGAEAYGIEQDWQDPFSTGAKAVTNAYSEIRVEPDEMAVFLTLTPARGGDDISLHDVLDALEQAGVVHGILMAHIEKAVQAGQCHELCIAHGTPATAGSPTRFASLLDDLRARGRAASEEATVDYRELGSLLLVAPGDLLMRRIPARPGKEGSTVTGKVLQAPAHADIPYAKDLAGVAADDDDPNLLRAAVAGVPALRPNGVVVDPVVEVQAVDLDSGNIDFDGALRVNGDIKAGMTVRVSADVTVMGTVEAATIMAGGDLIVHGGIVGGSSARTPSADAERLARVECGGSVQALFINHASVTAGHEVRVEREIFNSDVAAGHAVMVGASDSQGSIIGGRTRALRFVQAATLGSMAGAPTEVQVGVNPNADSQRQALERERRRLEEERDKIEQLMIFLQRNPDKATGGLEERVSLTHAKALGDLALLNEKEQALADELRLLEEATIEARQHFRDGVQLRIGKRSRTLLEDLPAGRALLRDDEVMIE